MLNDNKEVLIVRKSRYGTMEGKSIYKITLQSDRAAVVITNLGCTITSISTPDNNGIWKNIVAGFEDLNEYRQNKDYFGCLVGRYANRIADGRFELDGKTIQLSLNDGANHLHGGFKGFHSRLWDVTAVINEDHQVGVEFEYLSRDGEEGYPGNLRVNVKYLLTHNNELCIRYSAVTDKRTPVSLTNHSYFNLTGFEDPDVTGHILSINAFQYTEKNDRNVPTGNILELEGTPLNFLQAKRIGDNINKFPGDKGFDHNYILPRKAKEIILAAELKHEATGRIVSIFTDQNAIQLYTANFWDGTVYGSQGMPYVKHGAVALETQAFPDSPNHPLFPDTILDPGDTYHSTTIYAFNTTSFQRSGFNQCQ